MTLISEDQKGGLQRVLKRSISRFLNQVLPHPILIELYKLRARALTWDISRNREFEQAWEDAQASTFLSVVVPVHDAPTVTKRCLTSLEKYAPKAEIIIVNDGSKVAETSTVIADFGGRNGWKTVKHENPLGHSLACGAGAALATRPYLCLLNSDTVVTPWCWRLVKEAFERDQKIGVAGPSTSFAGTAQSLPLAATMCNYWNDSQVCGFAERLLTEQSNAPIIDLAWISGFAFFMRRSLWEALGGFDRKLPDYGNEVELCSRVLCSGYRTVWVSSAYIHHLGERSYTNAIGNEGILGRMRSAEAYTKQKKYS